jgi:hypothetical protein
MSEPAKDRKEVMERAAEAIRQIAITTLGGIDGIVCENTSCDRSHDQAKAAFLAIRLAGWDVVPKWEAARYLEKAYAYEAVEIYNNLVSMRALNLKKKVKR